MDLARRSTASATWNLLANPVRMVVLFARSLLLARLLPVETFGTYALAGTVVSIAAVLPDLGMGTALLHRAPETEDEEHAAAVHFTLKLVLTAVWAALMMAGTALLASGETRTALIVVVAVRSGILLCETPQLILQRRIVHRRLVLLRLVDAISTSTVAVLLGWQGATLWALLATDIATLALTVLALYVWRPVWRPRLAWSPPTMRYYLGFGGRSIANNVILSALGRVDLLWTGLCVGETALGLYSRAISVCAYPRELLATPVRSVITGTYAELRGDRLRLSRAFFRVNAFLVRGGLLLGGTILLVAPEFIRLGLGSKWLPMLDTMRLLSVFAMLAPVTAAVSKLFGAVGKPEQLIPARIAQLGVLAVGLFVLGPRLGIPGVALAIDGMLVVGLAILLWRSRVHVDYSAVRLLAAPSVAVLAGLAAGWAAGRLPFVAGHDWRTGAAKLLALVAAYGAVLLALESTYLRETASSLARYLMGEPRENLLVE